MISFKNSTTCEVSFYSLKGTDNKVIGKRSQNNTNLLIALPNFISSKYLFYFVAKIQEMMKNHGIYFNFKTVNSAAPPSPTPPPPPLFQGISKKCVFQKKGESFLKILWKFLKSFKTYEDFLIDNWLFLSIFSIFWHFPLAKKLMASA